MVKQVVWVGLRSTRLPEERYASFSRCAAGLTVITRCTGRYYVLPSVSASSVPWHYVIQGQLAGFPSTILSCKVISSEYFLAGEPLLKEKSPNSVHEANNRWCGEYLPWGAQLAVAID